MKRTDRAMGLYGAGVPIDEIVEFTGVPKMTVYSQASRRGVRRPEKHLLTDGLLDAGKLDMQIAEKAVCEAVQYWTGVAIAGAKRHAEFWKSQCKEEDCKCLLPIH